MSNLKKVLALALAFAMVLTVMVGAVPTYLDEADIVAKGSQSKMDTAVTQLGLLGIMVGNKETYEDEDGETVTGYNFRPTDTFKRSELARIGYAILNRGNTIAETWNDKASATPFTDISGNWARGYIAYAYTMGFMSGTSDTTFEPDEEVTGYELASMLIRLAIGYTADDIIVWPDDVDILGRTFGNNIFDLGTSEAGVLYEIDGDQLINRANAAVMIYNAICEAETVEPASNYSVGYYESTGEKFIESIYPDYNVVANAQIVAMGAYHTYGDLSVDWDADGEADASVTPAEGYIVYKYTNDDGYYDFYKQADSTMTRKALLESDEYEALGSYVNLTYYDSAVKITTEPSNGYKVIAVETQFASATQNTNTSYYTLSLTNGDTTYTGAVLDAKTNASAYNFDSVANTISVFEIADRNNADVIYAVVSGTSIVEIVGVKSLAVAQVATASDATVTFTSGEISADANAPLIVDTNSYTNLTKSDALTYAVGDYVLVNRIAGDANVVSATYYADVEKVLTKATVLLNGLTSTGAVMSDGTVLNYASTTLDTFTAGHTGYSYSVWSYNGLYYAFLNNNIQNTGNFLFAVSDGAFTFGYWNNTNMQWLAGSSVTSGYGFYTDVVFTDNVAKRIVVTSMNGVSLNVQYADVLLQNYRPAAETLYTYSINSDGTYNLYSVLSTNATTGALTSALANTGKLVANGNRMTWEWNDGSRKISNYPTVFAQAERNGVKYWKAVDIRDITALSDVLYSDYTAAANHNALGYGYAYMTTNNGWSTPSVIVLDSQYELDANGNIEFGQQFTQITDNAQPLEVAMAVRVINTANGMVEFMNYRDVTGSSATIDGTDTDYTDSVTIAADNFADWATTMAKLEVGDVVRFEYANETDSMVRFVDVDTTLSLNVTPSPYAKYQHVKDDTGAYFVPEDKRIYPAYTFNDKNGEQNAFVIYVDSTYVEANDVVFIDAAGVVYKPFGQADLKIANQNKMVATTLDPTNWYATVADVPATAVAGTYYVGQGYYAIDYDTYGALVVSSLTEQYDIPTKQADWTQFTGANAYAEEKKLDKFFVSDSRNDATTDMYDMWVAADGSWSANYDHNDSLYIYNAGTAHFGVIVIDDPNWNGAPTGAEVVLDEAALRTAIGAGNNAKLGQNVAIVGDLVIPAGVTVTVPKGYTLTIGDSVNAMDLTLDGKLVVDGTLKFNSNSTFVSTGTVTPDTLWQNVTSTGTGVITIDAGANYQGTDLAGTWPATGAAWDGSYWS